MAEPTEENLYSVDPDVLIPLVHGGKVNGYPVLDHGTNRAYVYVLCHMADNDATPFVTWSIWRTEKGKIAAGLGHYVANLADALIDLRSRAGRESGLRELADAAVTEAHRLAGQRGDDRAERTVWRVTAADLDAIAGYKLDDEELEDAARAIDNSGVGETIFDVIGMRT